MSCLFFFSVLFLYLNCLLFYFWVICMCCWLSVVSGVTYYCVFVLSQCCIISKLSFVLFLNVLYVLFNSCYVVSAFWCHILFCVGSLLSYIWKIFCLISGCFIVVDFTLCCIHIVLFCISVIFEVVCWYLIDVYSLCFE